MATNVRDKIGKIGLFTFLHSEMAWNIEMPMGALIFGLATLEFTRVVGVNHRRSALELV